MSLLTPLLRLAEDGRLPDPLVRLGIRRLCRQRNAEVERDARTGRSHDVFTALMRDAPIAPVPEAANEQHYELPAEFFARVLGPRRKYSGCYWGDGATNLAEAEDAALEITADRAGIADGQTILDLGCGWGSLTFWLAERYPNARIIALSNSNRQRHSIEARLSERAFDHVQVITNDANTFDPESIPGFEGFDRIVSVEMFEHMRNYEALLARIAGWLRPDGAMLVHIFCHRAHPYTFETQGAGNWMGRYFFTGGIMPHFDIFDSFTRDMIVSDRWFWSGSHYGRTAEAWLANLDADHDAILEIMRDVYGPEDAHRWLQRWRIFFMACAEMFSLDRGATWGVGHYRLVPSRRPTSSRHADAVLV